MKKTKKPRVRQLTSSGNQSPRDNRRRGNPDKRPEIFPVKTHGAVNQITGSERVE